MRRLLQDVAVVEDPPEQLLRDGVVVARGRPREQVVGQAQALQVLGDDPVVAVGELPRADAFAVGLDEDRRLALTHCVLVHHGAAGAPGGRFGSPEAVALYRINAVDSAVADALPTVPTLLPHPGSGMLKIPTTTNRLLTYFLSGEVSLATVRACRTVSRPTSRDFF